MKTNTRRLLYTFALLMGLVWIIISRDTTGDSTYGMTAAPQEGFLAPDISLPSLDGETLSLSDLRGKGVLVNLWATWCPPCRAEMPAIEKIYGEYQSEGFVVLAVNMTYQDTYSEILPFANEYKLTFPILLDENNLVGSAYQLRSLPSSYFIDRRGIIREVVIGGPMAESLLRVRVEEILK